MTIPSDYYEAEVRDGFYVPSEMKRCWAATIGVLEEIDKICKKHNLQYFADYGTLLGAVRHGGFIPWDDDFDISMKRDDYMAFLKVAQDELPENYVLLSVHNNYKYDNFLARVVNSGFISLEEVFLEKNHNFPFAVGIDIFPLDYFDYNNKENETIKELLDLSQKLISLIDPEIRSINEIDGTIKESVIRFCEMCSMPLEEGKPVRQQLFIINDRICSLCGSDAPYLASYYFWGKNGSQICRKEYYDNTITLSFEYILLPAPIGYDAKLTDCYGPGYMRPIKGGGMHDYPVYGKQRDVMIRTTGKYYYKEYAFNPNDLERPDTGHNLRTRKEVVILPFRAKYWAYLEEEWRRLTEEENTDVYVIPIPYYDKGVYGLNGDIHYEADMFPDYVPITAFDQYDFDNRIPDRIIIQNPFDKYDCSITVHPRFYTDVLRRVTRELVYIPPFVIDDSDLEDEKTRYTADFFIKTPGVTRSDKVYLQSSAIRDLYIEKLCEFAGNETRTVWEERLEVREYIKPTAQEGIKEEDIPDGWWKYLLNDNNEGKKVILFHTNVSDIVLSDHKYIEKLKRVLGLFNEHTENMTVIWQAHSDTRNTLERNYPELWKEYQSVLNRFLEEDYGIYDDTEDYVHSIQIADAYYGDRDKILFDFARTGRPLMIMNVDV